MNYSQKFSAIDNLICNSGGAAVSMQPMMVRQPANALENLRVSGSRNRRYDDHLPIMIHAGDVVVIDGNHGHDHIDLRGYSVDDALFHGNTIEILKGTEHHFVIEYKNVRVAYFGDDICVDL